MHYFAFGYFGLVVGEFYQFANPVARLKGAPPPGSKKPTNQIYWPPQPTHARKGLSPFIRHRTRQSWVRQSEQQGTGDTLAPSLLGGAWEAAHARLPIKKGESGGKDWGKRMNARKRRIHEVQAELQQVGVIAVLLAAHP